MILLIIALLAILWVFGFLPVTFFDISLFTLNGQTITVVDLFIFGLVLWAIGILPSPFRQIGIVLAFLWALSVLGIIGIANFSSIVMLAFIVGLVIFAIQGFSGRRHDHDRI